MVINWNKRNTIESWSPNGDHYTNNNRWLLVKIKEMKYEVDYQMVIIITIFVIIIIIICDYHSFNNNNNNNRNK